MPREHDSDFQGSFFGLVVDGLPLGYFTACSGISLEFDVVKFKEGDGAKILERKRPGRPKYSEITMKRGFTQDTALHDWFNEVVQSTTQVPYKTASITVMDRLANPVATFNLEQCWPSKLSVSDLKAGSDEVMIEELTMQHELLNWV